MNFANDNPIQGGLPQFSEITSRSNSVSNAGFTSSSATQLDALQTAIYTTAPGSNQSKQQILVNPSSKYPGTILAWPDANTLMQLCEKQGIQAINIPNYSQNSATLLSMQPNTLPVRIIPNMYLPTTSQTEMNAVKHESEVNNEADAGNSNAQQSVSMAEYFQKLQATSLPLTLQQLIKIQSDQTQIKKEKDEEQKVEQAQSILNIPTVPVLRTTQVQQNGNHFMSAEHMIMGINPNEMNLHIESQQDNPIDNNTQVHPIKVEQQIQTDSPKTERKMKFRAKTGEIKITVALDGSTLYCCPECNLAFAEKSDIEQHIQGHIQERKYQCKECGAMLKRKEHLDQHMRGHSDERPFKCPVCQKAFKRNEHLTRHYVIHSGDKNFSCSVCQKAFSRKDHLNKHTQTHLGIRKSKAKKDNVFGENKDILEKSIDTASPGIKQEMNFITKDGNFVKQEYSFLQHIQSLQKDPNLLQTFSAFKEQALREGVMLQQQAVNMNEILPQNTRYLMPS
ncbi:zinc finger protein 860 isoform X2 [Cephus cinctus]|uniref:Zinc finger protein 860 isoform X2 n=1 Tax=Cephus cinctus TaxID=211228 RepID=A0AAJ7BRU9_CEPCN|nr:zinc finger protein 860 isoform X2 [Cephus cinctus]